MVAKIKTIDSDKSPQEISQQLRGIAVDDVGGKEEARSEGVTIIDEEEFLTLTMQ